MKTSSCKLIYVCFLSELSFGINAFAGNDILLKCPYKANKGSNLNWFKLSESTSEVYSENDWINKFSLTRDVYERLTVTGNHTIGEYNLNISDVKKSDQGVYECSISSSSYQSRQQMSVLGEFSILFFIQSKWRFDNKSIEMEYSIFISISLPAGTLVNST